MGGHDIGPTKKFVDGLVRKYVGGVKLPAILCIQEAVAAHVEKLARVLNDTKHVTYAPQADGSTKEIKDMGSTQFEMVAFNSSGPEGIAMIADANRVGTAINLTPPVAEKGCMGVRGRAYQIVFFPAIGSLVVNLHGPNPAVDGAPAFDRTRIIEMSEQNPNSNKRCHAIALENWLNETLEGLSVDEYRVHRVILAGDFNDAMPLYYYNQAFLYESLPIKVRSSFWAMTLSVFSFRRVRLRPHGRFASQVRLGEREFEVELPMHDRTESDGTVVPMPPVTCCQYALDKKTRLPGDYVMSSCPSQTPLDVIIDSENRALLRHGMEQNDGMFEIDPSRVVHLGEESAMHGANRFNSDNIKYGKEFDAIAKGRNAEALAWYASDEYRATEPVAKMYSDHLAVAAHFDSMDISVCSFNISFMFSDPFFHDKPFPSERLAFGIANAVFSSM